MFILCRSDVRFITEFRVFAGQRLKGGNGGKCILCGLKQSLCSVTKPPRSDSTAHLRLLSKYQLVFGGGEENKQRLLLFFMKVELHYR